jgi:allantoicase
MSQALKRLNDAPPAEAEKMLLSCCGSRRWALKMVDARPFRDVPDSIKQAREIWRKLDAEDWLEAFAAHPKIGARQAASNQSAQSAEWSRAEQSGMNATADAVRDALAETNCLYEAKFGYIFIVCATGKSAEEMLELCRMRLNNDADEEIRIAADEQRKITEIRLKKLLEAKTA